jgi:tetratricopeptide (TPR) repeat protein
MKQFLLIPTVALILFSSSCNSQELKLSNEESQKIELAKTYISSLKSKEAIDLLKDLEGKSYEAKYLSACAYRDLNQHKVAEEKFKEVYDLKPDYRHTCLFLAQSMLKRYDLNQATQANIVLAAESIQLITEGIEYNKQTATKDMLAKYYATRGQLVQLQGEFTQAIDDLTKAINLNPQGDYYSRRAMSFHFNGQDDLACKDFAKGREMGETYNEEEIKNICR